MSYIYIVSEDFVLGHIQACLSVLGSQTHMVLFSSDMGRLWVQSHIDKKSAPLMPYKYLAQAWVYHYHTKKGAFEGRCPSRVLSALGQGWDWLAHVWHRMIPAWFCNPWRARLYHYHFCGGGFCSWPPASLFVRFGESSPHDFVLKRHGKTLSAVPHWQKKRQALIRHEHSKSSHVAWE